MAKNKLFYKQDNKELIFQSCKSAWVVDGWTREIEENRRHVLLDWLWHSNQPRPYSFIGRQPLAFQRRTYPSPINHSIDTRKSGHWLHLLAHGFASSNGSNSQPYAKEAAACIHLGCGQYLQQLMALYWPEHIHLGELYIGPWTNKKKQLAWCCWSNPNRHTWATVNEVQSVG